MVSLDEIRKLPASDRIKKLKELEEERKKELAKARKIEIEKKREIEEAKRLLLESASEIEKKKVEEFMRNEEEISNIVAPREENLEEQVMNSQVPEANNQEIQESYIRDLARIPAYELYQNMQGILSGGHISDDQMQYISNINYALEQKKKDIERGDYSVSEKIVSQIDTTKKIIDEIMGSYKR